LGQTPADGLLGATRLVPSRRARDHRPLSTPVSKLGLWAKFGAYVPRVGLSKTGRVLFGASRLTPRYHSGPPLRAFSDASRHSQGGCYWCCNICARIAAKDEIREGEIGCLLDEIGNLVERIERPQKELRAGPQQGRSRNVAVKVTPLTSRCRANTRVSRMPANAAIGCCGQTASGAG
jgi:hypothetical protein